MLDSTKTIPRHPSGKSERRGAPQLRVIYSPSYARRSVYSLLKGEMKIGRETEEQSICFDNDSSISKQHAQFQVSDNDGAIFLRDNSKNGTFCNGVRLEKNGNWQRINEGDTLRFGETVCMIRYEPVKPEDYNIPSLVGHSMVMRDLRCQISKAAKEDNVWILLRGETGCGKEVVARAIHQLSPRHKGPFVAVNCAAIPESLASAELFGNTKSAFTGAAERTGCFRAAHGGTLFLDEIGDMDPKLQPQLFRVLSEREVVPLGSERAIPTDFRLVSATNQPVWRDSNNHFRKELFGRIAQFQLYIPPLRDRKEDIVLLLLHFFPESIELLTGEFVERLLLHDWPLNVRQLFNLSQQLRIERSVASICQVLDQLEPSEDTSDEHEPAQDKTASQKEKYRGGKTTEFAPRERFVPTQEQLGEIMKKVFGNVSRAAEELQCDRKSVRRYLKLHKLVADDYRQLKK